MTTHNRSKALLTLCRSRGLDALLVSSIPNIRYLSGFTGSSAHILVSRKGNLLFTDFRYQLQARREVEGFRTITITGQNLFQEIAARAARMKLARVGFEAESIPYAHYRRLKKAFPRASHLTPSPPLVERIRMRKSRGEVGLMSRLAKMADELMAACRRRIRTGMTEREVVKYLERMASDAGAEALAFPPIVASGANGAMAHHRPGGSRIRSGAPVIIDFGLALKGYNSDLTRTFHLGKVARRYSEVYSAVLEAQQVALQAIKPGVPAGDIDSVARDYLSSRGLGELFGHGLGHGIGLEVHESPRLGVGSREILREGMVFTVEPGVYVPGWGGVRIEDMVVVRKGGCRLLTSSAKEIEDNLL